MITEVSEIMVIQLNGRSSVIRNIFIQDLKLVQCLLIASKRIHWFHGHFS
jgi:hypothetical protein